VDHYIILTGATSSGYVYNDPAISNGSRRTITEAQLQTAQRMSSIPGQGAAFAGPAPVAPPPTGPTQKVTVKVGDTLSQIAERYSSSLQDVVALNRSTISDVNHIEVGQVIKVPEPKDDPTDDAEAKTAPAADTDAKAPAPANPAATAPAPANPAATAPAPAKPDAKPTAPATAGSEPKAPANAAPTPPVAHNARSGLKIQ
jgi:LysM repeat protein